MNITTLSCSAVQQLHEKKQTIILDVRTPIEYQEKNILGSMHIPMNQLKEAINQLDPKQHYSVLCLGGKRATQAAELLAQYQLNQLSVIEGGIQAWEQAGLALRHSHRKVLPLMRQVQIVIGIVSLSSSLLALFVNPLFVLVPACLGAGLIIAGSTGWCGLALLLAKMPWNQCDSTSSCCPKQS